MVAPLVVLVKSKVLVQACIIGLKFTIGFGYTTILTVFVDTQTLPPKSVSEIVTLYIVLVVGLAVGLAMLVLDKPVAGDHV